MLFGIRKSRESSEKKSSPQEGNTKNNKPDKGSIKPGDSLADQAASLEETLNERTKDLEKTEEQLVELSNTVDSSDGDKDAPVQPNKPKAELLVEEKEETSTEKQKPPAADNDLSILLGKDDEGGGEGNSLSNLFNQEDDEVNPLAGLIASLPDVTAMELINEAQETKEMIREWQQT